MLVGQELDKQIIQNIKYNIPYYYNVKFRLFETSQPVMEGRKDCESP
jgi:hypothetical protein